MIVSKAVGSKRAAQCRILAITNEQREENKTYERKAERRNDSLCLVEMCVVSSFSCQHFFKPPQRKEEDEEEGGIVLFYFLLLRVPVYLCTALFAFIVIFDFCFFKTTLSAAASLLEKLSDMQPQGATKRNKLSAAPFAAFQSSGGHPLPRQQREHLCTPLFTPPTPTPPSFPPFLINY